jgi:hypothetical protein
LRLDTQFARATAIIVIIIVVRGQESKSRRAAGQIALERGTRSKMGWPRATAAAATTAAVI